MTTGRDNSGEKELKIILVGQTERFEAFASGLQGNEPIKVFWKKSGAETLEQVAHDQIQIVAVDEKLDDMDGLELVNKLAEQHPFVNSALVSTSTAADFHEETEGLGVLMQLPDPPDSGAAAALLSHYKSIWA